MTEPRKTTSARTSAKAAADSAAEAASEAKEAVNETIHETRRTIRDSFAAVRDNEEVRRLRAGTREFLRKAEDPALILTTAINPALGLGAAGIVKGSRLAARGLRNEARTKRPVEVTQSDSE